MKLGNKIELEQKDIIKNIRHPLKYNEWNRIGKEKVWIRKCDCNNIVFHKHYPTYRQSFKHNKKCEKCRQLGKNNSFYGKSHSKFNKKRWSKKRTGIGNPMYGKAGFGGKHHSEKTIIKQQVARKKYWKKLGHKSTEFEKYRNQVDRLTRKQPIHLLEHFEKRGTAGIDGAYHLDHVLSVWNGFDKKIKPEIIANIDNLQFIPWMENQKKWWK